MNKRIGVMGLYVRVSIGRCVSLASLVYDKAITISKIDSAFVRN